MGRSIRGWSAVLLVGVAGLLPAPDATPAAPLDRLDRFRELARTRLASGQADTASYQEAYELLDAEVVDNLAAGGVFASQAFLEDRLRAFAESWGGITVGLVRSGGAAIGAFGLAGRPDGASVRVYARVRDEAVLVGVRHGQGAPALHAMRPGPGGAPQVMVVWEGEPLSHGATPLRAELLRVDRAAVRVVWRWAPETDGEVAARHWTIRLPEIRVHYELRYPGWVPGCDGQTEQEDVFRYSSARHTFVLLRRRLHRRWHRELHAALERVLTALHQKDARALLALVPDRRLRASLPAALEREAACDAAEGARPAAVSVAAVRSPERQPWVLGFRRTGASWQLVDASPVLE